MARRNPTSIKYKGKLVRTPTGSLTHAASSGGKPLCSKRSKGVAAGKHDTLTCSRCAKLLALNAGLGKKAARYSKAKKRAVKRMIVHGGRAAIAGALGRLKAKGSKGAAFARRNRGGRGKLPKGVRRSKSGRFVSTRKKGRRGGRR